MKYTKWIGVFAFVVLVMISYQPWVYIASMNITVTGLRATGTNFGRPAVISIFLGLIAVILFLVPYLAAKRINLFVCALNLAWAIRNFVILSTCREGDCPQKEPGLYIMLAAAVIMLAVSLFPDVKLDSKNNGPSGS